MPRSETPYVIQDPTTGAAISGATINIYTRGAGDPPNTPAVLFKDETSADTYTQPIQSDSLGQVTAWLNEGSYTMAVSTGSGASASIDPFSQAIESISGRSLAVLDGNKISDGSITTSKIIDGSITAAKLAVGLAIPTGSMFPFAGNSAPVGFLLCQGQTVSRTTYSALFNVISTTYGVGDGSTTFALPDTRSRVLVGSGQGSGLTNRALGAKAGTENETAPLPVHSHSTSNDGQHQHSVVNVAGSWGTTVVTPGGGQQVVTAIAALGNVVTNAGEGQHNHAITSAGTGGAHNNMQPYIAISHMIKI